jgi:hypothetical protein
MYMVASRTQQGAVGEGPDTGVLADLQLPADTWHAYGAAGGTATLCGIALTELCLFPDLTFLPVRCDDVCSSCLAAAER